MAQAEASVLTRRLFFTLWPDDNIRQQLATVARHWSRQPVATANLHMTLVFLGDCTVARQQCVSAAAGSLSLAPFDLALDSLGGWPESGTQWLGPSVWPAALGRLVKALRIYAGACGLSVDSHEFVPHVTLSRREPAPRIQADLPPLWWSVHEFGLAESRSDAEGNHYHLLARWPLIQESGEKN